VPRNYEEQITPYLCILQVDTVLVLSDSHIWDEHILEMTGQNIKSLFLLEMTPILVILLPIDISDIYI